MLAVHPLDQLFGRDSFRLCPQHDGGAVRVVGADVPAFMPAHFLEANPDVGLDVFHQMTQVDGTVGIRQGGGDENSAAHGKFLL